MNWLTPSLEKRLARELERARHELLTAQSGLESYTHATAMLRQRIQRLEKAVAPLAKGPPK